jgi:hypothetical protein
VRALASELCETKIVGIKAESWESRCAAQNQKSCVKLSPDAAQPKKHISINDILAEAILAIAKTKGEST